MPGDSKKQYWQSLHDDGPRELPVDPAALDGQRYDRRGFLALMGLSAAAMSAACSRSPVGKVLPYVQKPEEVTPGLASYYASTCGACPAACGVLLKTRDGRPIKVEGNDLHPVSGGGVCAVGQASVLSLYDASRARAPSVDGHDTSWAELDAGIIGALRKVAASGKAIRVVTPSELGPTAEAALGRFVAAFPVARRVRRDTNGEHAIAEAHLGTHGIRAIPAYRFERARVIVGVGADFLGTWRSPVALTRRYAAGRDPASGHMSRHWQIEPRLTLTGSCADRRVTATPSDTVPILAALARRLRPREGAEDAALAAALDLVRTPEVAEAVLDSLVADLTGAPCASVVLCGSDDPTAQTLTNLINERLGAYGTVVDLAAGVPRPDGVLDFDDFLGELRRGQVGAVILWGVNPVYDHPRSAEIGELLRKVELAVSTADRRDETASLLKHHAPDHDPLESWGDVEPERGTIGVRQPAVSPLFDTRSACESILRWASVPATHHEFMRARWEAEVFPAAVEPPAAFQAFWDGAVQVGFARVATTATAARFRVEAVVAALKGRAPGAAPAGLELVLYEKVGLRDGRLGNNGWLHELPDPITKVTWSNYAVLSPALAAELGVDDGAMVEVRAGERAVEVPALIEPGVHRRVVALAVGYGRTRAGSVGNGVGVNAFALGGAGAVTVARGAGKKELARSQTHSSLEGRPIVKEASLSEYRADPAAGNEAEPGAKRRLSMWSEHAPGPHRWGMTVNLSACTGCSACVVACQAENNIPVVGEDEVRRRRDMAWMRIDRYFAGTPEEPEVVHQPMMCQHCTNAPCETVCPVLATMHSSEGLNQQAYNRCVGTRYCANNCPTKVRRFNWFDYPHEDPLARMVLNPDVVVRSRGVMEKCSLCVQRIQEGKARARADGRPVRDGDIQTACQQGCPAGAITFGDLADPASKAAALAADPRAYRVLDELNIEPGVVYLTRIKNPGGRHG